MNGAHAYAALFSCKQYDRLYISVGKHARGSTFNIYVLPEGVEAITNGDGNPILNKDAVEVYGVLGGNPGWTEYYGWIHKGPWCDDFLQLVIRKETAKVAHIRQQQNIVDSAENVEKLRINKLLSNY